MGARVPRTRAGNTWTESRYFQFIRSALRAAFSRYPVKYAVKNAARREVVGGGRQKYEYQCNSCKEYFPAKETEVDHIVSAGSLKCYDDLPGFVERMFCEADGMQVLCKPCHQGKTNADRRARSETD